MKNQLSLGGVTSPSTRVAEAVENVSRATDTDLAERLADVIEKICAIRTRKVVAYELDVAPSQLSDSLTGNGGKQLQLRWLPTIVRLCPAELRDELRAVISTLFEEVELPLSPDEEDEAKQIALEEFGRPGREAHERARAKVRANRKRSPRR